MNRPRLRMSLRGLMVLVLFVALLCGLRAHVERWEVRRAEMYLQRDVTESILLGAWADIRASGRQGSSYSRQSKGKSHTRNWMEKFESWENRGGRRQPLIRARVSGANGEFALAPITVETYGSPLDRPWLDRLLSAYRTRGWRYRVITSADAEPSTR